LTKSASGDHKARGQPSEAIARGDQVVAPLAPAACAGSTAQVHVSPPPPDKHVRFLSATRRPIWDAAHGERWGALLFQWG